MEKSFPLEGILPKEETQAFSFIKKNPNYDGRGIKVAIFDTGVCLGAEGLQTTSDGQKKIIDAVDTTGSGDVITENLVKGRKFNLLSGRNIEIPETWKCPSEEFYLGLKRAFELYPLELQGRIKNQKKKEFTTKHSETISKLKNETSKDSKTLLEQLNTMYGEYEHVGPILDIISFYDGKDWCVGVLPSFEKIENIKVLRDYKLYQEYSYISEETMLYYSVKVYNNGKLISLVVVGGAHGTHVAGIVGSYYEKDTEKCGVAPGCQIISVKIGDSRLGTMETGTGLIRGIIAAKENGCHIINMSYGEYSSIPNYGRFIKMVKKLVNDDNIIFVSSAGNNGPGISTCGAPGGTTEHIIGVGAYVSPSMMKVEYSIREDLSENMYTWSSRGPTVDGDTGVNICAPGGAISCIPTYLLARTCLMNGTSMSSPNATGCISLLLSGLKQNNALWTQYSILTAVQNTARKLKGIDEFATGRGLIQVEDAFEHLIKFPLEKNEPLKYKINIDKNRGIYLRNFEETKDSYEVQAFVSALFHKDSKNSEKLSYEKKILLKNDKEWIKSPDYLFLSNDISHQRGMSLKIDCKQLKSDSIQSSEILGYDYDNQDKGPIIRIPVTVIKPIELQSHVQEYDMSFKPGQLERHFINVPNGSQYIEVKIRGESIDTSRMYCVHLIQILPQVSFKETTIEKWVKLTKIQSQIIKLKVIPNTTIELCVGQNWASLGDSSVKVNVEFYGVTNLSGHTIHLNERVTKLMLQSNLRLSEMNLKLILNSLHQQISPTEHEIKVLNDSRNRIYDRDIYELILTYQFNLSETTEVTTRVSSISEILYESNYESQLYMIFNSNKMLVHTGDAWPKKVKLSKDDYTLKLHIRHHELKKIERLKNLILMLESNIKEIVLDIYSSMNNALSESKKITNLTMKKGETQSLFIKSVKRRNLPNKAKHGDSLVGTLKYSNDSFEDKIILNVPIPKPKPTTNSTTEMTLEEKLLDQEVFYLEKCSKENFLKNIENSIKKNENYIPLLFVSLRFKESNEEKIQILDKIISLIDTNELALHYGMKNKEDEKIDKKKKQLIDAWSRKLEIQMDDHLSLEEIKKSLTELKKWTELTGNEKMILLDARYNFLEKNYGETLKIIKKYLSNNPYNKNTFEWIQKVMNELGLDYWYDHLNEVKWKQFPLNYLPF